MGIKRFLASFPIRDVLLNLAVFAIYFLTADIGLGIDAVSGFASLVWPPTGIAIAAVALRGYIVLPGILLGATVINASHGAPFFSALGIGFGNATEAYIAILLYRRLAPSTAFFGNLRSTVFFILCAGFIAPFISASVGVLSLWLGAKLTPDVLDQTWFAWWLGDSIGALILAPTLILLFSGQSTDISPPSKYWIVEGILFGLLFVGANLVIFSNTLSYYHPTAIYLIFLPFLWSALQFGRKTTLLAMSLTAFIAVVATLNNMGPFVREPLREGLLFLQVFMGVTAISLSIFATIIAERALAQQKIKRLNEELIAAQEMAHIANWQWKPQGNVFSASSGLMLLYGLPTHTPLTSLKDFLSSIHPYDRKLIRDAIKRAHTEYEPFDLHYRIVKADGVTRIIRGMGRMQGHGEELQLLGIVQDVTDQKEAEETIRYQAYHDPLTGLANRKAIEEQFIHAQGEAREKDGRIAIIFLDLDHFKKINDLFGHYTGDLALQKIAHLLASVVKPGNIIARLGGDEFIILVKNVSYEADVVRVARSILYALNEPLIINGHPLAIMTSIGIALYPHDGHNLETLLRHSDRALYRAKALGRNQFQWYDRHIDSDTHSQITLESELWKACEENEIVNYYQPIVDVHGNLQSIETLARWQHPRLGLLAPAFFISLAEKSGAIVPLGERVLYKACKDFAHKKHKISVNISGKQLAEKKFIEHMKKTLKETGFHPRYLEVEITETMAMENPMRMSSLLKDIKRLGVTIAIDDFGVGYSSFNYLKRFPIDTIKIDKSFIQHCLEEQSDLSIVKAILDIGHSLGIKVVAEGIENSEQLTFLQRAGCDAFQGHLIGRAMTAEHLTAWAQRRQQLITA